MYIFMSGYGSVLYIYLRYMSKVCFIKRYTNTRYVMLTTSTRATEYSQDISVYIDSTHIYAQDYGVWMKNISLLLHIQA